MKRCQLFTIFFELRELRELIINHFRTEISQGKITELVKLSHTTMQNIIERFVHEYKKMFHAHNESLIGSWKLKILFSGRWYLVWMVWYKLQSIWLKWNDLCLAETQYFAPET